MPTVTETVTGDIQVDEDDVEDETLTERLMGLTEMFPERLRNAVTRSVSFVSSSSVKIVKLTKSSVWVIATSAAILVLPVMFETERAQIAQEQVQHQQEMLLGPTAAVSRGQNMMPGLMQMPQPQK